jgi:multidrug efflux pump subunit AcrB
VNGGTAGLYRHGSKLLPIVVRPPEIERNSVTQLEDILVFNPVKHAYVNIGQVINGMELEGEDALIKRRDRKLTLSVLADPVTGITPATLHSKIRGDVESIKLPEGYALEWGGEYEAQQHAITTILGMLPLLGDVFFQPMAVTIMFGLGFATLLTLIVVPVLFALFYRLRFTA